MKKTLLSAALVAVVGAAVVPSAFAADGKITFKGTISDVTCTVTGGAGTDGGVQNFTVTLPTIPKTALDVAGDRAGDTPFSVIIGGTGQTGCTNGKMASLRFEPAQSPIDAATGRLINSIAAGSAAVVQVGLLNDAKQDINLGAVLRPDHRRDLRCGRHVRHVLGPVQLIRCASPARPAMPASRPGHGPQFVVRNLVVGGNRS